jgi:hypothetical protein
MTEQADAKISNTNNSFDPKSSPTAQLLLPASLSKTNQPLSMLSVATQSTHKTPSPRPQPENRQQSINTNYMLSTRPSLPLSPLQYSSIMNTPEFLPSTITHIPTIVNDNGPTLIDITNPSKTRTWYSPVQIQTYSLPLSEEEIPPPPTLMGTVPDKILMALTEPFLMAWCQDVDHASLTIARFAYSGPLDGQNT